MTEQEFVNSYFSDEGGYTYWDGPYKAYRCGYRKRIRYFTNKKYFEIQEWSNMLMDYENMGYPNFANVKKFVLEDISNKGII